MCGFVSIWHIRDEPIPENILNPGVPIDEDDSLLDLNTPVNGFMISLPFPKYSQNYVEREFFGGTLYNLFRLIYNFYQEPVSASEVFPMLETSQDTDERQMLGYYYKMLVRGHVVKRIQLDFTTRGAFGGFRKGVLKILKI